MSTLYQDLPLTTFPEEIDNIQTLQNITTTDAPLVRQFQSYMLAGNFASAQEVLNQIQNGTRKILTPTYFNTLREAILALERFYKSDVEPYIDTKQAEWENIINQMLFMSTFNPTTQYQQNNYVLYTPTGGTQMVYICTATPPVGTVPTNTSYWRVLTVRGSTGPSGPGASFRYEWNSGTSYSVDDVVTYENKWYIATQANTNQTPAEGSDYWNVILELVSLAYPVQANEPTSQDVGMLWFQIV